MSLKNLAATALTQNLENRGRNWSYLRGQPVDGIDDRREVEVLDILSKVTSNSDRFRVNDTVSLFTHDDELVIEVHVNQLDSVGRQAGISLHTLIHLGDQFPKMLASAVREFAKYSNLTLPLGVSGSVEDAAILAQKKREIETLDKFIPSHWLMEPLAKASMRERKTNQILIAFLLTLLSLVAVLLYWVILLLSRR